MTTETSTTVGSTTPAGKAARAAGRRDRPSPAELIAAAADRFRRTDLRNTWQVAAGAVLVPLGVVVIAIAWYGSAHTPYIQQQIPYLVSGSFVGLGFMVVGALLYWAHWLYRIYDQADLHHVERMQRDQQLFDLMQAALSSRDRGPQPVPDPGLDPRAARKTAGALTAGLPGANGSSPAGPGGADLLDPQSQDAELVATASGTNVHRRDCPIVARHPAGARRLTAADANGRPPCRICHPVVSA